MSEGPADPHPSFDLLAGGPEQAGLLQAMVAGTSLVITGAGGTGKTTVVRRYMAWLERESRDTEVHHLALQTPADAGRVKGYSTERLREAARDCYAATLAGTRVVAVIDEYTLIEPDDYPDLLLYDQVIATGDPAQDRCAGAVSPRAFVDFMGARGALTREASRVWRSNHLLANALLDYYAYGGRGTSLPAKVSPMPDVLRANRVPDDPEVAALAIFARLLRTRAMNRDFKTAVAARDPRVLGALERLVGLLPDEVGDINASVVDPAYMQGLETDILLVYCPDFDRVFRTPDSIARAATTTLGRARTRTELLFADDDLDAANGRLSYTLFVKMMLAHTPEARTTHPGFASLEPVLNAKGIDLVPIDRGVMLYSHSKNTGFKVSLGVTPRDEREALALLMDWSHLDLMGWGEVDAVPEDLVGRIPTSSPIIENHATIAVKP